MKRASPQTEAMVKKLDSKVNRMAGYESSWLAGWLGTLEKTGRVEVGWRESCGSTDVTMKIYREWLKVVKSLRRDGLNIAEENVKHKNGSPTRSGGFWSSIIYSISAAEASKLPGGFRHEERIVKS